MYAFFLVSGDTYFFKGENMYKFYDMKMKVALNWPKPVTSFLGCGDSIRLRNLGSSPQRIADRSSNPNSATTHPALATSLLLLSLLCIVKQMLNTC